MGLRLGLLFLAVAVAASAIDRLDPKAVLAGSPAFTLKVFGTELEAADQIRWKRDDEAEWRVPQQRFISDRLIELEIPAAWVAMPGSATVQLQEDGGGGYTPPPGPGKTGRLVTEQPRYQEELKFEILPRSSVPVARDDSTQTLPGVPVVVNVVANDSIPNGLPNRAVSIRRGARNGFVRPQADSTVLYEPNAGFEGEDSFAYIVEDSGGLVVSFESCTGVKPILDDVDEGAADPIRALAEKYLHLPCSVMTPNRRRMTLLKRLAEEYRPQCVIDLVWQACITYDVESAMVKRLCEEELGLPFLRIETDYTPSDSARVGVRVEALFETVRARAGTG